MNRRIVLPAGLALYVQRVLSVGGHEFSLKDRALSLLNASLIVIVVVLFVPPLRDFTVEFFWSGGDLRFLLLKVLMLGMVVNLISLGIYRHLLAGK